MKKHFYWAVMVVCFALILSGCAVIQSILNPIPEEYTEGIRVPRDYPDDDLEIYDDATVFETEDNDDEITLKYGTSDEIDDVIDFYEDIFEDNNLSVTKQEDDKDEFYAEGMGDGFTFEIEAYEAKGGIEERLFMTVVEVYVKFGDTVDVVTKDSDTKGGESKQTETPQNTLLEKMEGFWHACGSDGVIRDSDRQVGLAYQFTDGKLNIYISFVLTYTNLQVTVVDEDTISFAIDGYKQQMDILFETIDGINVITLRGEGLEGDIHFEETNYSDFITSIYNTGTQSKYDVVDLYEDLTDEELEYYISELEWEIDYYMYSDGAQEEPDYINYLFLTSNYEGYEDLGDEYYEITWYLYNGTLYITYPSFDDFWAVDYSSDGTWATMYMYDKEEGYEGGAWVFTAKISDSPMVSDDSDTYITIDADTEDKIVNKLWEYQYYTSGGDSRTYADVSYARYFNSDYTGTNYIGDSAYELEWHFEGDMLVIYFVMNDEEDAYPVKYTQIGNVEYLYLENLDVGYEGGMWVYAYSAP